VVLSDVGIDSGERVVKNVDIAVRVKRTGNGNTLALTAGKVDTALTDLSLISSRHQLEIAKNELIKSSGER